MEEKIADHVFQEIFAALKNNVSVEEINLECCKINDAKAIIIADALKINKNIKKINLDSNYAITSIGVTAITDALEDSHLTHFGFCNHCFTMIEAKFFAKIFENCKLLKNLTIDRSKIDQATAKILAKGISGHKSVQYIEFKDCIQTSDVALTLLNGIEQSSSLGWVDISISFWLCRDINEHKLINKRICEILKNNGLLISNDIYEKANCSVAAYYNRNIDFLSKVANFIVKEVVISTKTIILEKNYSAIKWLKLYQKFNKAPIFEELFYLLPVDYREALTEEYINIVNEYNIKKYFYITGVNKNIIFGESAYDDNIPLTWLPKELWNYILSFLGKDNLWTVKYLKTSEKVEVKQIAHKIDETFIALHDQDAELYPLVGDSNNN